jgi:hypothetical protein
LPVITKVTADGGSVYLAGTNVTYDIDVNCNTGKTGNLYMTDGSLTDPLPTGMIYVSSSPTATSYDSTTNTLSWSYPAGSSTPAGCATGSSGATAYQIVATAPDPAPSLGSQPLVNVATFAGQGPDAAGGSVSGSTDAQADIDVVQTAPSGTGTCSSPGCPTISKSSLAPLDVSGLTNNQYQGTYPGNWITTSSTPTYNVGQAPGSYQVAVRFPLTHTYQTQVVDPLPCLANVSGNTYSSDSPTATACTDPAFDTTVVEVSGPGVGEAVANGWTPTATEIDNTTETLTATGSVATSATSAYYSIGDVGHVADVVLPATPFLVGNAITLTVWGYADSSLANTDVLANAATATPYLSGSPLGSITATANLYIVGADFQLGISKSFGTVVNGGTTVMNIEGAVNFPDTLTLTNHPVVLTDLLPSGLDWSNVATTGTFTVNPGGGASSTTTTAAVTYTEDYEGLGRNLIRVTVPDSAFASGGTWTITPPTDFFEMTTPAQVGTYPNTDQIFLSGFAPSQIDPQCTTPTQTGGGISPATFESFNPMNLAGDGNTQEDYCQNSATMVVSPTGAAFSLTKTVQGNLDSAPKGGLGVGDASGGGAGTGTYGLTWTNVGTDTLDDPVVYDILPFVGDTGVSQGQAGVARDSAFAPTFTSVSVPSGITVEYSQSTNPCRNQVYPDTANTGCVDDWSTTAPSPLSDVKAVEFTDTTNGYPQYSSFSVSLTVTVPNGDVNEVAWNSAATNASDVSDPSTVPLPAEPPKVGLVAPSGGPSLTTTPIGTSALAYSSTTLLNDSVTVTGTNGNSGTLDWSLVGPVYPVPGGGCSTLNSTSDWSGVAVADSGSITIPAEDGIVTVGPATVQGQGCYSWTEDLTLDNGAGSTSLPAGDDVTEFVQALPYDTTLSTTASPVFDGTNNTATDSITVDQSGLSTGHGAPTSDTLTWDLYGPAPAAPAGSCSAVDWTPFTVPLDSGTIDVTGDGTYTTTSTDLTSAGIGCYTYTESLPASTSGTAAATAQGVSTETFALITTPQPTTSANQSLPNPRTSVTDAVTVSGTSGYSGTVAWSLLGPVTPIAGSCSTVSWSGAMFNSGGNQNFTGDQTAATVPTAGTTVGAPGCYSWTDQITGPDFLGSSTGTGGGNTGEVFQVVPYQPTLVTTATPAYSAGTNSVTDTVLVGSSDLGGGNGAPATAVLTWTLYGPVSASGGSCPASGNAAWQTAATQTNTKNVKNGSNTTSSVTLTAIGCYSYTDSLAATGDTLDVATTSPGVTSETFQIVTAPTMSTLTNQTAPNPRASVSDGVTIAGTDGLHGTVTWSLVGPVTPIAGSCATVSWAGAAVRHANATQTITGDGTVNVPSAGTAAGAPGCYSWIDTLSGPNYLGPTPVGGAVAGNTGETFLVPALQPTLTTTIDPVVAAGVESATDSIMVAGTDIVPGNTTGGPTTDSMTWTLLGPVTPVPSGGCSNVTAGQWTGTTTAASGTIAVTANTTYTTPSTNLTLGSCYSYTETLAATTDSLVATSSAGLADETTPVPPAAVVTTTANQATPGPRTTVSDSVTITGTGGGTGSIAWSLVGPVTPVPALGCTAVSGTAWSGTTVRASGTQSFTGDQTNLTVPSAGTTIGAPGCYSWTDTVSGTSFPGSTVVAAGATGETLVVPVLAPTLVTTINPSITAGVESATDSVTVAGTDIVPGNLTGAPTTDSMAWTLLGPVTPVPAGGCANVSAGQWTAAVHAAAGAITVTANTTYTTPSTNLTVGSCYSYTETLAATTDSAAVTSSAGMLAETTGVPAAPTVTTATSASLVYPHTPVSDSVTIAGIGIYNGSLAWALVGPVAPVTAGTCAGVSWSSAPVTPVGSGTIVISTDGTVTTGPVTVGAVGCYGWTDTLTGTFPGTTVITAGAADEVVLVQPHQPVITTTAVLTTTTTGTQSMVDDIAVNGSGIATSGAAPSSAVLTWSLVGPVAPVSSSCTGLNWTGAPVVDSATITVTGDGAYATASDALTATGCFSYTESLAATVDSLAATSAPGVATETALMLPPPTVITASSDTLVYPYSQVSDTVSVTGTTGRSGVVAWTLVGPVAPAADGTCNGIVWTGAAVVDSGVVSVSADGNVTAGPTAVDGVGCYSWTDAFTGSDFLGQTAVAAGAAAEVILVQPFQPVLTTHATDPDESFFDTVNVSGSGIDSAPGAPTSAVLTWTLLGPAPAANGGCATVTWSGQKVLATGTIVVTSDGNYNTPSTGLDRPGCYTFYESLSSTAEGDAASTDPGVAVETDDVVAGADAGDGLGSIGTDLGRWVPGHGARGAPVAGILGLMLLAGGALVLARRRRHRRA